MKHRLTIIVVLLQASLIFSQGRTNVDWYVTQMKYDEEGLLTFTTTGEPETDTLIIESFKWNKWVMVAKVQGQGESYNNYKVKISTDWRQCNLRIRYAKFNTYSSSLKLCHRGNIAPITFRPAKVRDSIWLSKPTYYEIYDGYGTLMLKGKGKTIYTGNLKKGVYYINYDIEMGLFRKM